MGKVVCENCGREYALLRPSVEEILDSWDLKDLAEFDGWETSGQFIFCPDCKSED